MKNRRCQNAEEGQLFKCAFQKALRCAFRVVALFVTIKSKKKFPPPHSALLSKGILAGSALLEAEEVVAAVSKL